jgi:hypothetical protein
VVYEDISNEGIYDFLDELANVGAIDLRQTIKPYSRAYIAKKLQEASAYEEGLDGKERLTTRQKKELHFYLQDFQLDLLPERWMGKTGNEERPEGRADSVALRDRYDDKAGFLFRSKHNLAVTLNPLAFLYQDPLFTLSVKPILGFEWLVNQNSSEYHRWWGGSMAGYIGRNFGFYANIRDNNESTALAMPEYFTLRQGAVYKGGSGSGVDYSEMRGGIVVSWNWGSVGLLKERIAWGSGYHGQNILSGKAPSFPMVQLHINPVKWFDFNYVHAWLNSDVIDSSRSYYNGTTYRAVYRNKFYAANMFTFIPWRGLNLSVGNSIVYSDDGVQPAFLIPFMFFNSVDATGSSYENDAGQNSQIFIDISSRQINHLNVYVTLFIDELKMSRVNDPGALNWTSWKAGFRLSDFPLRNVSLTGEWTKTNPITYKHYIATTTFASNNYCMGHYLRDNSMEIFASLSWKPLRGVLLGIDYTYAVHGDDYPDDRSYSYDQLEFIKNKTWQVQSAGLTARYEFISNGYFLLRYQHSSQEGDAGYQPDFMHGVTDTFSLGLNVGF